MSSRYKDISKFLSYLLRHHPEAIGLEVDAHGWAHLPSLIRKANRQGRRLNKEEILQMMGQSNKQRFTLSGDGKYIRAGYGHSIEVDLQLDPCQPPETLYHGTAEKHLSSIYNNGLQSQNRKMVHLSADYQGAVSVGGRHGKPVVLRINAKEMYNDGRPFYQSASEAGIWLVQNVAPVYIHEQ